MTGTLVVTIGRNIGAGKPLPQDRWDTFKETVRSLLGPTVGVMVFAGHGDGEWEGKTEESYTVILIEVEEREVIVRLEPALARVAALFEQDCIAVTFGETNLVRKEVLS